MPGATFHQADLARMSLPDKHVDLLVCGLALCRVDDLGAVFAEFARVLRPGGRLVISNTRGLLDRFDHPVVTHGDDDRLGVPETGLTADATAPEAC